jgi:hypothetical protein
MNTFIDSVPKSAVYNSVRTHESFRRKKIAALPGIRRAYTRKDEVRISSSIYVVTFYFCIFISTEV